MKKFLTLFLTVVGVCSLACINVADTTNYELNHKNRLTIANDGENHNHIQEENYEKSFDESLEPIKNPGQKSWTGYFWGLGISALIILAAVIYRKRTKNRY